MGLFEHLPYTNFHELNLAWLLRDLKAAGAKIEDLEKFIQDMDIPEDVEKILEEWLNDGTIENMIGSALENYLHPDYIIIDAIQAKNEGATNTVFGDCFLISGSVNGIIDFGNEPTCYSLIQKMREREVSKIDFVVISHYHLDHVTSNFSAALGNLIGAGIDFSECTWYLPHLGINYSLWTGTGDNPQNRENEVKAALTAQGMTWTQPADLQEVQLTDGIKLRFSNIGNYSTYYSYCVNATNEPLDHTNYNSFSMVTEVLVYDRCCLFTGDIDYPAQVLLAGKYHNVEVYKIEHHALEATCPREWINSFSPKVVLLGMYSQTYIDSPQYLQRPCLVAKANQGAEIIMSSDGAAVKVDFNGSTVLSGGGYTRSLIGEPVVQGLHYNDDLNEDTFRSPGFYLSSGGDMSATIDNTPYTSGGFLMESRRINGFTGGYRMQILYPSSKVLTGFWYRRADATSYQEWRYVQSSDFTED